MNEITELQRLLGKIYSGEATLAPQLVRYRYIYKEDFGLRFLYTITRVLHRMVTHADTPEYKKMANRPREISHESLVWFMKKRCYLTSNEMKAIEEQLSKCEYMALYTI